MLVKATNKYKELNITDKELNKIPEEGEEFEVTEEKSIDVDLDGEAYGRLPLSIRVCHNAIRLLIPPPQD